MEYHLEKNIWTDSDFQQMGWHDCTIHQMRLGQDLELDIDYILKWNKPDLDGLPFTFWVSPATLVFKSIQNIKFDFDFGLDNMLEIDEIERPDNNTWCILTQFGHIEFSSAGYEQFIRQEPLFVFGQSLPYIERGGHSLDRVINQENPNRNREDILLQRQKDFENYELFKKRHVVKGELEQLAAARESNQIDTKQYILKKKELSDLIYSYEHFLKGTIFER